MKYIYVLVSDSSDIYYEQALLSITSLRMHSPDTFVILLVDDVTESTLIGTRAEIKNIISELKSINIEKIFNKLARSRFLKTTMREHIEGDFLYIDNDTVIADDLSSIENTEFEIGAVLDSHIHLYEFESFFPARIKETKNKFKKTNFGLPFDFKTYFNGGIIFCKDCPKGHEFFKEWHRLWMHCFERGILTDQQALNQANYNLGNIINELSGIWNCQLINDGSLQYLHEAKILHYFSTNIHDKAFLPANIEHANFIKKTGNIDPKTLELLKKPKSAFASNTRIMLVDKSLRQFYDSAICGAAKRFYGSFLGKFTEFIFAVIKKYIFTPIRKKLYNLKKS